MRKRDQAPARIGAETGYIAVVASERVPYLQSLASRGAAASDQFPFNLPFLPTLDLTFNTRVTFFVGENGSGKSTLLEAIAQLCRLPVSGGGRNEAQNSHGPEKESPLAPALRGSFHRRPWDGFFLRAEFYANFATLLDQRRDDPDFWGDPYALYGGKSLHRRSHGEAFMEIVQGRMDSGMFLLDEPESALSPQRQLALLASIASACASGESQFVIATHSPILMTYPGAVLIDFDQPELPEIAFEDTRHYQITKGILDSPERYWQHLRPPTG